MDNTPLSSLEQDVAELASVMRAAHTDAFLLDLVRLADSNLGVMVALLVSGMIVVGRLGRAIDIAEDLDAELSRVVERPALRSVTSDEEWGETKRRLKRLHVSSVEAADAWRSEHAAALEAHDAAHEDDDELPGDLHRNEIMDSTRGSLTLVDAVISAPGVPGVTRVPVMRIRIASVSGWWILPTDENGMGRVQFWEPVDSGVERPSPSSGANDA